MGRGKLTMELIEKEKPRMITYEKRKKGLKKKAEEFSTLCGVPTCMIIYGPKLKNRPPEVDTWPENQNDLFRVVNMYKDKTFSIRGVKSQNVFHLLADRKRKADDRIAKLRKSNLESLFSSKWDDRLNSLSIDQLNELANRFDMNIQVAKKRILAKRGDQPSIQLGCKPTVRCGVPNFPNQQVIMPLHMQFPSYYHPSEMQPLQMVPLDVNPVENPMTTMVMMNGGDSLMRQSGFNGGLYSEVQTHHHMYVDPTAVMVDNVTMNNQRAAMCFYDRTMQPLLPYEQCLPPQMHGSQSSDFYSEFNAPHEDKYHREKF